VKLPPEIFEKDLTAGEFKVVIAMYQLADRSGVVDASMDDLGVLTKYKREMLRRCVRSLEAHGLITTRRKRRNFNKYHGNVYRLTFVVEPPNLRLQSEALEPVQEPSLEKDQCLQSEASTAVCIASNRLTTSFVLNTSYLIREGSQKLQEKEEPMSKWKKSWDEDNLGSVGLFDEELLEKVEPKTVNKRDPRTRLFRPTHEWTSADVSAEFGDQLRRRFPQLPALINTQKLAMILAKYRRELSTTALVELELIKMFFEDEKKVTYIARNPEKAMGTYLNMFKSRLSDVMDRLDMPQPQRNTDNEVARDSDYVYASDGTKFENTLVGRKALQRHEERLITQA
jgi:hypothetical protein